MNEWINEENVLHIHRMEYYSTLKKKEGNPAMCDNMDKPGGYYA